MPHCGAWGQGDHREFTGVEHGQVVAVEVEVGQVVVGDPAPDGQGLGRGGGQEPTYCEHLWGQALDSQQGLGAVVVAGVCCVCN